MYSWNIFLAFGAVEVLHIVTGKQSIAHTAGGNL